MAALGRPNSWKTIIARCRCPNPVMDLSRLEIGDRGLCNRRHAGGESGQALFELFRLALNPLHLLALLPLALLPLLFLFPDSFFLFLSVALFLCFAFAASLSLARQFFAGDSIFFLLLAFIS